MFFYLYINTAYEYISEIYSSACTQDYYQKLNQLESRYYNREMLDGKDKRF